MKNQGMTLLEVLVAIVVLSTLLLGATNVMTQTKFSAVKNERQIVATTYLQECLELTRNVRDSAVRQNVGWSCPFKNLTVGGQAASINVVDPDPEQMCLGVDCQCDTHLGVIIKPHAANPKDPFVISGTPFDRSLTVLSRSDDHLDLQCTVGWNFRGKRQEASFFQTLTPWHES